MNAKTQFNSWSPLNSNPAIVRAYSPDKANFVMTSDYTILVLSDAVASEESIPTKDLIDRLSALKTRYSEAWIPDTIAPKETAFQDARAFVLTLPLTRIVKPMINVAGDGEVNFEWRGRDFHIDLGFYGNHMFSYYAKKEGCAPLFGDDIPVKSGIPGELTDFASAI
jgi:hypothetical protein